MEIKKSSKDIKETRKADIMSTNEDMVLEGYAVVFESPATHGFTEIIDKKALDNTDMTDVALKYNHMDNVLILARTRNKSLTLKVDDKGLYIRAKLIDTQMNKDVYKMVKEGLLDKMSFAFTVRKEEWNEEVTERRILDIDKLFDVSVVDIPFYDDTELYARSKKISEKKKLKTEKRKLEMLLKLKTM